MKTLIFVFFQWLKRHFTFCGMGITSRGTLGNWHFINQDYKGIKVTQIHTNENLYVLTIEHQMTRVLLKNVHLKHVGCVRAPLPKNWARPSPSPTKEIKVNDFPMQMIDLPSPTSKILSVHLHVTQF